MGVKLDYQFTPGFLNILEGVVRPAGPSALEFGFLNWSHEEIPCLSDRVVDNEEFHFFGLAVFIQKKESSFDTWHHFGMLISKVMFCWSYKIIQEPSAVWEELQKELTGYPVIVTSCSVIFEPPLLQPLPVVMWGAVKSVLQGWKCINNTKLFIWKWLSQVQPPKCAII